MSQPEPSFFESNLFLALVTILVGSIGLYLYYRRKRDNKRRIAKIILLEIENAQSILKEVKRNVLGSPDSPLPENVRCAPSDTWTPNKHLFIEDFNPVEWNAINEFYSYCQTFDDAIKHNDSRFGEQEKELRRNVHKATYNYTVKYSEKIRSATSDEDREKYIKDFFKKRNAAVDMLTDSEYMYVYTPNKQNHIVLNCLNNVDMNLSLNTVGRKFTKIGKSKLLF